MFFAIFPWQYEFPVLCSWYHISGLRIWLFIDFCSFPGKNYKNYKSFNLLKMSSIPHEMWVLDEKTTKLQKFPKGNTSFRKLFLFRLAGFRALDNTTTLSPALSATVSGRRWVCVRYAGHTTPQRLARHHVDSFLWQAVSCWCSIMFKSHYWLTCVFLIVALQSLTIRNTACAKHYISRIVAEQFRRREDRLHWQLYVPFHKKSLLVLFCLEWEFCFGKTKETKKTCQRKGFFPQLHWRVSVPSVHWKPLQPFVKHHYFANS